MFTVEYKGALIHGYYEGSECFVTLRAGFMLGRYKSVRGARGAITRYLKKHNLVEVVQ